MPETTTTTVRERTLAAVLHALDGRCTHCFKPLATQHDWDTYQGGEGEHLCWEEGDCRWEPLVGVTRESVLADALATAGVLLPEAETLARVHHEFHHDEHCRTGCADVDEVDEAFAQTLLERAAR